MNADQPLMLVKVPALTRTNPRILRGRKRPPAHMRDGLSPGYFQPARPRDRRAQDNRFPPLITLTFLPACSLHPFFEGSWLTCCSLCAPLESSRAPCPGSPPRLLGWRALGAQPHPDLGSSFFKPRKVLVRTLNDGPDTGRIIVGRSDVPAATSAPETPSPCPGRRSECVTFRRGGRSLV
jgi:hypothetical protein